MPRKRPEGSTRQIYASIREDIYLLAKARAAELRVPMREFIEMALQRALSELEEPVPGPSTPSVWDDEYLLTQAEQPLGSPVELTPEEAERVARAAFGSEGPSKGRHSDLQDAPPGG